MIFSERKIKIFGLPRSGTNYVHFLLRENFLARVLVDDEGWKHGYISPLLDVKRQCVLVCKNPFSWIISVYNYFSQKKREEIINLSLDSIDNFTRNEFIIGFMGTILSFRNPIECWNVMNRHWLAIPKTGRRLSIVRHEDLLVNPAIALDGIAIRKTNRFIDTNKTFIPTKGKLVFGPNFIKKDHDLTPSVVDFIKKELDDQICGELNYLYLKNTP